MKTYRAKHFDHLSIPVYIAGKQVYCQFTGGVRYPTHIRGSYNTNDPSVQEKLEAHPLFNKQFVLEKDTGVVTKAKDNTKKDDEPRITEVKDIKSLTQARAFLNRKYSVQVSKIKNRNDLFAKAEELNVVFPDLVIKD